MKTTSLALILLAGLAAASGPARADETVTAVNKESRQVARESAGAAALGAPVLSFGATGHGSLAPAQEGGAAPVLSMEEHSFLKQGDRGIGLS